MSRGCSGCGATLSATARFCEACGTPVGMPALQPVEKRSDPASSPQAARRLDTPLPARDFEETVLPGSSPAFGGAPQSPFEVTIPEPGPAWPQSAIPSMAPWQWGVAFFGAALLLFTISRILSFLFIASYSGSALPTQLFIDVALGGLGACGLAWALRDKKTALTAIATGMLLRSGIAVLSVLLGMRAAFSFLPWLVVIVVSAGALGLILRRSARERGDGDRLATALTVVLAAQVLSTTFSVLMYPYSMRGPYLAALAMGMGALALARFTLPRVLER